MKNFKSKKYIPSIITTFTLLFHLSLSSVYAYNISIKKAISATDSIQWQNVGNYIYDTFAYQHASKNFVKDNPLLATIITDPAAAPKAKQAAMQIQLDYIADQLGITRENLYIYMSSADNTGVAAQSAGFRVKTGDIYLNTANDQTLTTTLGHEVSHAIDQANNKNYGEDYADLMGDNLNNALNTELKIYGFIPVTNQAETNEQWRELYNDDSLIIK